MIDIKRARKRFKIYLKDFDTNDGMVALKIRHTFGVMKLSEYIAKDLGLSQEDIDLALLIALLHDIGRFQQAKLYKDFRDYKNMDHAEYAVEMLFKDGLIREFVEDDSYDNIIMKAIRNHNKLDIEEGLEGKELLHAQIIRDADKTDNFRVKVEEDFANIFNSSIEQLENSTISNRIYDDFMNSRVIVSSDRVTDLDYWVSYLAFIFDYNFDSGLKYIKDNDYINLIVDRINYKNPKSKEMMEIIRMHAIQFLNNRLNNGKR